MILLPFYDLVITYDTKRNDFWLITYFTEENWLGQRGLIWGSNIAKNTFLRPDYANRAKNPKSADYAEIFSPLIPSLIREESNKIAKLDNP